MRNVEAAKEREEKSRVEFEKILLRKKEEDQKRAINRLIGKVAICIAIFLSLLFFVGVLVLGVTYFS